VIDSTEDFGPQIDEVARYLRISGRVRGSGYRNFDRDTAFLDGSGTVRQTEQAVFQLGLYLGLNSSRPDSEIGTGPDVLWTAAGMPALSMELKTEKLETSRLTKSEVGQVHNHIQWCMDNVEAKLVYHAFVSPTAVAEAQASPSPEMVAIKLKTFELLALRLHGALDDITNTASAATLQATIREKFRDRGLLWPDFYNDLHAVSVAEVTV
jgi:hypothetical protein